MYPELGPKISLAIDKGHNIRPVTVDFLYKAGFKFQVWSNGSLHAAVEGDPLLRSITLNRGEDIPYRLEEGVNEFGIFGRDILKEAQLDGIEVEEVVPMGISLCRVVLEVPIESEYRRPEDLHDPNDPEKIFRIATSYPNQAELFFSQHSTAVKMVKYRGGEEGAVDVGAAEAVVAVYDSGTTANENHLRLIAAPPYVDEVIDGITAAGKRIIKESTLLESEAVLVTSTEFLDEYGSERIVRQFITRIAQTAGKRALSRVIVPVTEIAILSALTPSSLVTVETELQQPA